MLRILILLAVLLIGTGCQLKYLIKNGYHQARIWGRQISLDEVLTSPDFSPEVKRKVELTKEVNAFMSRVLKLETGGNYTSYVQLDQPYVTYAVSGAFKFELKPYEWNYPIVGRLPYRGHFELEDAKADAAQLEERGYDSYLRGVSAFSTLGWFQDPLLSSMLRYEDKDLVNVLIHETVHANIFIKGEADFNERLATYIGNIATEMFFLEREGPQSENLGRIRDTNADDRLFSEFLGRELPELERWYADNKDGITEEKKETRLAELQSHFEKTVWPRMKTKHYQFFLKDKLNNAKLLAFRTYLKDLSDFEKVYEKLGRDFQKFFEYCRSLEKADDPELSLKQASITTAM